MMSNEVTKYKGEQKTIQKQKEKNRGKLTIVKFINKEYADDIMVTGYSQKKELLN